jgi:hypothetical protein
MLLNGTGFDRELTRSNRIKLIQINSYQIERVVSNKQSSLPKLQLKSRATYY